MANNEILVPEAEVLAGRYVHYKNREYVVLGLADHSGAVGDYRGLGLAVLSGTEEEDPPICVELFHCEHDRYHYTSVNHYGTLVVYRPDYGARRLTVRPIEEFLEPHEGQERYRRIGDA